ncbi:rhamnose ABC transporter substrate-binding protein [Bartonella sp. HY329]|uniref:rhamnose ABC transporter substrate-binding protein n=1 Tax=unclassified Bartonella TaxID=2645622 RepID=UPI0021C9842B|nr:MULTISPECIES: rhamnose ABC transporter substrate-binding protein [unclassified Bartonella]UXM94897.1 rhamnose ABC transporter substrate-binding protein [Bartonella sp. HY329]UXN09220.1 rhamnose ABC transporter substrate-binding protein [Bartonella sp. HY328]
MRISKVLFALCLAFIAPVSVAKAETLKIGLVAKVLGNGFFEAANRGAQEAAKEIGDVNIIYTGPTTTTAEGQIEVINSLIAQGVDVIAISANDPDAVVPILKRAMQRGIKVISWDSGVAPQGRMIHLNPSSTELIGETGLKLIKDHLPDGKGDFAIVSATTTSTNQNIWIAEMKKHMSEYPELNLVTVVYGDDLADKSYREAQGILSSYPNVKVIMSPSTVGILSSAQAVTDAKKVGDVFVTGFGLPSEMAGAVKAGVTNEFAIWNPVDLGYSVTYIAKRLVDGDANSDKGSKIDAGRMGELTVGDEGEVIMAPPFIYDKSNIDEFSKVF